MSGRSDRFTGRGRFVCLLGALATTACGADERPSAGPGAAAARDESPESAPSTPTAGEKRGASVQAADAPDEPHPVILFFGNSLTAGLGLAPRDAFPGLIQIRLDSLGLAYRAVNAGVSGESSAGGLRRIDRFLDLPIAILVLELGANDGMRGQNLAGTRDNLQGIIDRARERRPEASIVIAGLRAPPNYGEAFQAQVASLYVELARSNGAELIPFLLEGVAGVPRLNQPDGIHPTAKGHAIIAETVWRTLAPLLREGETGS